jgi:hypothetical protein
MRVCPPRSIVSFWGRPLLLLLACLKTAARSDKVVMERGAVTQAEGVVVVVTLVRGVLVVVLRV